MSHGVIGIVRAGDAKAAAQGSRALLEAGLTVVEVSLTTPGALGVIEQLAEEFPDAVLGAGTVLDEPSARLAVLAGATFLVAPNLEPAVVRMAHRYGAAAVPGVGTGTEVVRALELGADLVKLFPASSFGGPGALKDLMAALPQVPAVPTGGIGLTDAASWIAAGAVAVGMGSSLTKGGPSAARETVSRLLAEVAAAKVMG